MDNYSVGLFKEYFKGRMDDFSVQKVKDGTYFRMGDYIEKGIIKDRDSHFTDKDIQDHLFGRKTYAIYLIDRQDMCWLTIIDIDTKDISFVKKIINSALAVGIERNQVLVEDTGGRGFHIWIIYNEPIEAEKARKLGQIIVAHSEIERDVEVFPKQNKVSDDGFGSSMKLPFGIHKKSNQRSYILDNELNPIPIWEDYLISFTKTNKEQVDIILKEFDYLLPKPIISTKSGSVSLPCFKRIMELGVSEGQRDNISFRLAVFFKKQGMTADLTLSALKDWNKKKAKPPLKDWIIEGKVRSVFEHEYSGYGCDQEYMKKFCSPECPIRKKETQTQIVAPQKQTEIEKGKKQKTMESYNLTDLGNAERFVSQHSGNLFYCHPWHKWLVWDNLRWAIDTTAEVWRYGIATVRHIYTEAEGIDKKELRSSIGKHALSSESEIKIRAMLSLAEKQKGMPVKPEELDRDHWLLNVLNGTINLKTGELKEHKREDLITKLAIVNYNTEAVCPKWLKFLNDIMIGNQGQIDFLQRVVGYCLTGKTGEHKLFFLFGSGQNGKTTFLKTLQGIMGDYAIKTDSELLIAKPVGTHTTHIADLQGRRLAITVEIQEGRRLAEALTKELTGSDTITARRMRQDNMNFEPTHKIILGANHKPIIHETTMALWRRIDLIPFNFVVSQKDRVRDYHEILLNEERDGIFLWAVEGCKKWQKEGLLEPKEVEVATREYRTEMDILADFLADCCVIGQGERIANKELREVYEGWCQANGEKPISAKALSTRLQEKGFIRICNVGMGVNRGRGWQGLGLNEKFSH